MLSGHLPGWMCCSRAVVAVAVAVGVILKWAIRDLDIQFIFMKWAIPDLDIQFGYFRMAIPDLDIHFIFMKWAIKVRF